MEKIAICITTHNRKRIFEHSLSAWRKYKPDNADIFVVDDCSIEPVVSNFRFDKNVGIATAKNKCLELAEGYDHIFLTDDDVRPKVFGWEQNYVNSGMNHLCLTYDKNSNKRYYSPSIREEGEENGIVYYTAPNGCMLYLKKICLEKAGGMRNEFGLWGFEHVEYTQRINSIGLTPKPFMDVKNSLTLFDVLDWRNGVESSLPARIRSESGKKNLKIYEKYMGSTDYVSYK